MYCGQCGKKVMDNMLFCPFCGSPIVIPEQDSIPAPEASAEAASDAPDMPAAQADARPISIFDEVEPAAPKRDPEPEFVPLHFDFDASETEIAPEAESDSDSDAAPAAADSIMDVPPELFPADPPAEPIPDAPRKPPRRNANTYIPVKQIPPEDMFMDASDDYDADDYDASEDDYEEDFPARPARRRYRDEIEDDFDFEEPEHGGFFQRHIRGIVALILLAIVLLICVIWAVSPNGQRSLARMNLAWNAKTYADLGYEAYHQDSDLQAARYYEKAYSRDPDCYEYAHSAMVAYYEAKEIESAAAMLKKCIEMNPDDPEPYQEMLILYPDAESRPWEIKELVRQGYQRTGDESLKME